jgi:hypothetical protein
MIDDLRIDGIVDDRAIAPSMDRWSIDDPMIPRSTIQSMPRSSLIDP